MNQEINDTQINSLASDTSLNTEAKIENGLLGAVAKCLTFAPLMLEQFTGQKVPQMTGTMAEIQQGLAQLNTNLQIVINNQKTIVDNQVKISNRLANVENNANQKLFNLTEQVKRISNVKLTHERERKQIEYNPQAITDPKYQ
jgi:hypothetical protein